MQDLDVQARETHSGVVVLVGERAYKAKKAVDLGFLDFTTRDSREAACRREVELNRRLAPDVYDGVAQLHLPDGTQEPVVVMRRMPDELRLATLVRSGEDVDVPLRALARQLAGLHARSERSPAIDAEGSGPALAARWSASFATVREYDDVVDPGELAVVERMVDRFVAGRTALFDSRVTKGSVVDGHGDLIADDIFCLPDGPRALDCLDFDDRLRYVDGIDDAAFLAMDLESLGAPHLADRFLDWYAEFAGDPAPASLRHHYVAYRAFVRAKVACLRYGQGDPRAAGKARELVALTHRHLAGGAVRLVLVGGLPGTGKSTLAGTLADHYGMVLLGSDRIRKELADRDPVAPAAAGFRAGIYTPAWTRRTYDELLHRAAGLLAMGESVVVDASWTDADLRERAREVARRSSSDLVELRCECPEDVSAQRLGDRPEGLSDADPEIAAELARRTAPWPEAVTVDTSGPPADAVKAASLLLDRPGVRKLRRPRLAPD